MIIKHWIGIIIFDEQKAVPTQKFNMSLKQFYTVVNQFILKDSIRTTKRINLSISN